MVKPLTHTQVFWTKPALGAFPGSGKPSGLMRFGAEEKKDPSGGAVPPATEDNKPTETAETPAKAKKTWGAWGMSHAKKGLRYILPLGLLGLPFILPTATVIGTFVLLAGVPLLSGIMNADIDPATGKMKNHAEVNRKGWKAIRKMLAPVRWIFRHLLPGKKWKINLHRILVSNVNYAKNKLISAFETKTFSSINANWKKRGLVGKAFLVAQLALSGLGLYIESRFQSFKYCGTALLMMGGFGSMKSVFTNFIDEVVSPKKDTAADKAKPGDTKPEEKAPPAEKK